jgi:hypothetical protein
MQTLEDIMRMLERDLEIADNAYMLMLKNYSINDSTGEIEEEKTEIKEIIRIDPPQVAMIADSDGRIGYDDKHNPVYVCPRFEHRAKRLVNDRCDLCGAKALRANFEVNSVYSIGIPQSNTKLALSAFAPQRSHLSLTNLFALCSNLGQT